MTKNKMEIQIKELKEEVEELKKRIVLLEDIFKPVPGADIIGDGIIEMKTV